MSTEPKKPKRSSTVIGWLVAFGMTAPIAFFYVAGYVLNNTKVGLHGESIFDSSSLIGPGIGVGVILAFAAFDIKYRFIATGYGAMKPVIPVSASTDDEHEVIEERAPRHTARAQEKELKKLRAANWLELHARHDRLMLEWFKYETDIGLMIDYPIMTDYTDPVIHKVVVAMQKIRTAKMKLEEDSGMDPLESSLNEAVNEFEASFQAAERYARRYGQSQLDPREQRKLSMARSALNIILDGESPAFEVEAAYKSLRSSLKGIIDVPDKALVEIEALVRREIVAS